MLQQYNFLLEFLLFLYQENGQSRWMKVRAFCCNLYNTTYELRNVKFPGFRTTVVSFNYIPQSFHISLHFVSNSNSAINFRQLSYESFLCMSNGSQLKLCLKSAEINFSYFAKIPPWLEMVGRKISLTQKVKEISSQMANHQNSVLSEV